MTDAYSFWHFSNKNPPHSFKAKERISEIKIPCLLLGGELDLIDFQEIASMMTKDMDQSTVFVIPNVGHLSNMENPETFNKSVLEFLSKLSTSGNYV